jgi:hypothetical protein
MMTAAVLLLLLLALPAHAQSGISGASSAVTIVTSPAQPAPNSTVRLTLQSPLFDLSQSLISWRVDGSLLTEGEGVVNVAIEVGAAGETVDVSASVISEDEQALAFLSITPASLDLLWEADGLTHPFYRGRTLPSAGASMTFVAYPTFVRNGARVPEADLVYTWRAGDGVLGSLSGKGRSTLTLDGKQLLLAKTISVDAQTTDGSMAARAIARLPTIDAPVRLYENHPLFGPMYHRAFETNASTPESEVTFHAFPYFAPVASESDPLLRYTWRVNKTELATDKKDPSRLTIGAQGFVGTALIELDVFHESNLFFGANAAWQITFSRQGRDFSTSNPFAPQQ